MATHERKYKGSLSLGKLELALEAHEQLFGTIIKLESVSDFTIATYDESDFPTVSSLSLAQTIGGVAPQAPSGSIHLFDGEATILGSRLPVSVYRTS